MSAPVGAIRGIPLDPEWIVSRPEKARPLARHVHDIVKQKGQGSARHVEATMPPKIRQRAAVAGKELRLGRKQLAIPAGQRSARQRLDSRSIVQTVGVMQTADQGGLVHQPSQTGQMLDNLQAGHRRGDRLKLTANFRRRIRLEVERVQMAWPAVLVEQDASA